MDSDDHLRNLSDKEGYILNQYYNTDKEDYILMPIKKIIFTRSIIDAIKKYGGKIPHGIKLNTKFTVPLNRMGDILDTMREKYPFTCYKSTTYQYTRGNLLRNNRWKTSCS